MASSNGPAPAEPRSGTLRVAVLHARGLDDADAASESDPYVVLTVDGMQQRRTEIVEKSNNPDWHPLFEFVVERPMRAVLRAEVFDRDLWTSDDRLGWIEVPVADALQARDPAPGEWTLNDTRRGGTLTLSLSFAEDAETASEEDAG